MNVLCLVHNCQIWKQPKCSSVSLVIQSCLTLCNLMDCRLPCPSLSSGVCSLMSIQSVMPSNHLILYCLLLFLPSIFPTIRVFSSESALRIRWSEYWSFSISPSKECSGLISSRIDWFELLAVQGTLKSLLQHQSSKVSVLQCSAFFMVQLSDLYMTTKPPVILRLDMPGHKTPNT